MRIRFKTNVSFIFYHNVKIYDLLCKALSIGTDRLGDDLIVEAPESGKINYLPSDCYVFGITKFGNDDDFIVRLKQRLGAIASFNPKNDSLYGLYELISIKKIPSPTFPNFDSDLNQVELYFISPLRFQRENREIGHRYFDKSFFETTNFIEFIYRRLIDIAGRSGSDIGLIKNIIFPQLELTNKNFMWVDMPYPSKTLGGIVGSALLKGNINPETLYTLWIGQFIHAGNNKSFGFGNYRVVNNTKFLIPEIKRYKSFLHEICESNHIDAAKSKLLSEVKKESHLNEILSSFDKTSAEKLTQSVLSNEYKPKELIGFFITKSSSTEKRFLALPDTEDRILQKAACLVLNSSIENLLENNSYAFRKGFSREGAARAIKNFSEKGFNFILKTDIESFFENVDWKIMIQKLETITNFDPICDLIRQWIATPILINEIKIERTKGLPQGCSISPMLSNLYLDEFDEALGENYKLIRYCDNIVIMCKSKEETLKAIEEVKTAASKLKLNVNEDKTALTDFKKGFSYLGYHFLENTITDVKSGKTLGSDMWMLNSSQITLNEISSRAKVSNIPKIETEVETDKFPIYISDDESKVSVSKDVFVIGDITGKAEDINIPLKDISSVTFFGAPKVTVHSVFELKDNNIPIFFCRASGENYLSIANEKNYSLWIEQLKFSENTEFRLEFAKQVITAKINNSRVIAMRNGWNKSLSTELSKLQNSVLGCDDIGKLRGFEGFAAKKLFDEIANIVPPDWKFRGRTKNPPQDPFNALLSFGYTILYNHISNALIAAGLNPEIGYYHTLKSGHNALASDLTEEFRYLIDSLCVYITKRNIIKINDFESSEDGFYPYLLNKIARKKFIEQVESRLSEEYMFNSQKMNYVEIFLRKAEIIKTILKNKNYKYSGFKIR